MPVPGAPWEPYEDAILRKYSGGDLYDFEIAEMLPGRTARAVCSRRGVLLLDRSHKKRPKRQHRPEHIEFVRDNWRDMEDAQIAAELGVVQFVVESIRWAHGWKRSGGHKRGGAAAERALKALPLRPRGYSREEHPWAKDNRGHPEADAILAIIRKCKTAKGLADDAR